MKPSKRLDALVPFLAEVRQPFAADLDTLVPFLGELRADARRRGQMVRPQPQVQPAASVRRYTKLLRRLTFRLPALLESRLLPSLERIVAAEARERGDAVTHADARPLFKVIDGLRITFGREVETQREQVQLAFEGIGEEQRTQFTRQTKQVLGLDPIASEPWLGPLLEESVDENVALIKTIPDKYLDELAETVRTSVRGGMRHEELAKIIRERFIHLDPTADANALRKANNRAKLIARDQTLSYYADVNRLRQRDLGVDKYIWRTARDERVRGNPAGRYPRAKHSHHARDGKTYSWDKPPKDGHPGKPINCRCIAEPVLDDLFEEQIEAERAPAPASVVPNPPPAAAEAIRAALGPVRRTAIEAKALEHAEIDVGRPREVEVSHDQVLEHAANIIGEDVTAETLADVGGFPPGSRVAVSGDRFGVGLEARTAAADLEVVVDGQAVRAVLEPEYGGRQVVFVHIGPDVVAAEIGSEGRLDGGLPVRVIEQLQELIDDLPYTSVQMHRTITREHGELVMHNHLFRSFPSRRGVGRQVFAKQVVEAQRLGIARIEANAYRAPGWNGYYTWARFGYDAELPGDLQEQFGVSTVQELMESPDGRRLWRDFGRTFDGVFDLEDGSVSLEAFEDYLRGRR